MTEKIQKLRAYYNELFGGSFLDSCFVELVGGIYINSCFIEVTNGEHAVTLSANREGLLLLVDELIKLCESLPKEGIYHEKAHQSKNIITWILVFIIVFLTGFTFIGNMTQT